ncbi:MAG: GxxExxY protein [Verrucomicrobiota bacterium]
MTSKFEDDSYAVIGCAMAVHRELGSGLREKPYENALVHALREEKLHPIQQKSYPILFRGTVVGDCIPDITVGPILIEVKSVESLGANEQAQLLNYLRIAGLKTGLLINFRNKSLEWERIVR